MVTKYSDTGLLDKSSGVFKITESDVANHIMQSWKELGFKSLPIKINVETFSVIENEIMLTRHEHEKVTILAHICCIYEKPVDPKIKEDIVKG